MDRVSRIETRAATPADRPFIEAGLRSTAQEHAARNPQYFTERRIAKIVRGVGKGLSRRGGRQHFVAERGATPVGYVELVKVGTMGIITDVRVTPAHRRTGVATALVAHAATRFRSLGGEVLQAAVWDGNDASHALFTSLGYAPATPLLPRSVARVFPALRHTTYVLKTA